ncbi:hypothetical protein HDU85_002962 [Gaertneriomyces sp. JEL0708]|nr:hypothetical protein HDU85_002962 [Gaertneriomyces sp. JEL0708]
MASMRDAFKRLQVIYDACAPEAIADAAAEKSMDDFTRLKKKIHQDVKTVRKDLKEREEMMASGGTTTESAEKSYRIRVAIRALKEQSQRLAEIVAKEERKKKGKELDPDDRLHSRKETLDLCQRHIEELENLEKRRFNDQYGEARVELLSGARAGHARNRKTGATTEEPPPDPFLNSELPDIDVEEDLKRIGERNKLIDQDLDEIGAGVARLKDIANDLGNELDRQNDVLVEIERGVESNLDRVDNLNIKMKKTLDGMMKGDRFIVNCVLVCVVLALVAFIAGQFS